MTKKLANERATAEHISTIPGEVLPSVADAHAYIAPKLGVLTENVRQGVKRVCDTATRPVVDWTEDDREAIHDYRVALRRMRTALRPLRRLYGKSAMRALSDRLKAYADATGQLRDEEVLHETIAKLKLPASSQTAISTWLSKRKEREAKMRAQITRVLARHSRRPAQIDLSSYEVPTHPPALGGDDLLSWLSAFDTHVERGPKSFLSIAALSKHALGRALAEVRAFAATASKEDSESMHLLRIRFKRLRYSAELLAPPLHLDAKISKHAAAVQKALGHLHDVDEALKRVRPARGLTRQHRQVLLRALYEERERAVERSLHILEKELSAIERRFDDYPSDSAPE